MIGVVLVEEVVVFESWYLIRSEGYWWLRFGLVLLVVSFGSLFSSVQSFNKGISYHLVLFLSFLISLYEHNLLHDKRMNTQNNEYETNLFDPYILIDSLLSVSI